MLACPDPALDGPVILFQDVVKVLHRTMSTVLLQSALGFELYDGWRVSGVLVGVDDPGSGVDAQPQLPDLFPGLVRDGAIVGVGSE
jgi:hypothetical protein